MTEVIFTVLSFGALRTLGLGLAVSEAAVVTALFLAFLQAGGGYLYRLCREPLWNFMQEPGCKFFDTERTSFIFLGGSICVTVNRTKPKVFHFLHPPARHAARDGKSDRWPASTC